MHFFQILVHVDFLLMWLDKWSEREKALPHELHWKGFTPVCFLMCLVNLSDLANLYVHFVQLQTYGFSPVCVLLCANKWLDLTNFLPQLGRSQMWLRGLDLDLSTFPLFGFEVIVSSGEITDELRVKIAWMVGKLPSGLELGNSWLLLTQFCITAGSKREKLGQTNNSYLN